MTFLFLCYFFFKLYGDHRDLNVLTHSFPKRRSSDLINSAVFPGLQGGPLMNVIAAKAVAFGEALRPDFKDYAKATIANAQALANRLKARGADVVAGGTDTHLALIDLRPLGITGGSEEHTSEIQSLMRNSYAVF